jgi:hypothetical protein
LNNSTDVFALQGSFRANRSVCCPAAQRDFTTGHHLSLQQGGKVRILAICGAERSPSPPDVPTVREAGIPEFVSVTWFALMAPPNTPNSAVTEGLREPDIQGQFIKLGVQPVPMTISATLGRTSTTRSACSFWERCAP